jgi:hypothetical protein
VRDERQTDGEQSEGGREARSPGSGVNANGMHVEYNLNWPMISFFAVLHVVSTSAYASIPLFNKTMWYKPRPLDCTILAMWDGADRAAFNDCGLAVYGVACVLLGVLRIGSSYDVVNVRSCVIGHRCPPPPLYEGLWLEFTSYVGPVTRPRGSGRREGARYGARQKERPQLARGRARARAGTNGTRDE